MSVEEENKALSKRLLEAMNRGDLDAFDELVSPERVQEFKEYVANYRRAFPDIHGVHEIQIAEGEFVANRLVFYGTHLGEFMGIAPTGEKHTMVGLSIDRMADGKFAENWVATVEEEDTFQQLLAQKALERERIEQELQVARSIQQASLPKEVHEPEGWQISPFYQPAREVGGDFYDFFELDDGRLGLVVGDATSKGVPAALVMASARSMLRAVAQASEYSPGELLRRVNDSLVTDIPPNMFVTCFYAILDPKSGSLAYANAGHDLPYLRRRGGDCEELRARGMPLGLMPKMGYEEKEVALDGGESALFYSDGLVEAHNAEGEMLGFPRLRELVAEHGEERSLGDFLMEELYSFVGEGWEQEDDITLLTLRRSATPG
jgi:serine phosphatase RsbU (regulator of sigma subunit)/predicted ester cyclase